MKNSFKAVLLKNSILLMFFFNWLAFYFCIWMKESFKNKQEIFKNKMIVELKAIYTNFNSFKENDILN